MILECLSLTLTPVFVWKSLVFGMDLSGTELFHPNTQFIWVFNFKIIKYSKTTTYKPDYSFTFYLKYLNLSELYDILSKKI